MLDTLANTFKLSTLHGKAGLVISAAISSFFTLNLKVLIGLAFLIIIDLMTGIRAHMKENDIKIKPFDFQFKINFKPFKLKFKLFNSNFWKAIKSSGLRQTANKCKDYLWLILALFALEFFLIAELPTIFGLEFSFTTLGIAFLGIIEVWSIGENIAKTRGFNFFKSLFKILTKDKTVEEVINEDIVNQQKDDESKD